MYFPKPTYVIPTVSTVASWALEQWASGEPWFSKVPFSVIFWGSLAFLAGLVVQDLYNAESWLRKNILNWQRVFSIEWAGYPSLTTQALEAQGLRVRLRIERASKASISVRVGANFDRPNARNVFGLHGSWSEQPEWREQDALIEMDLAMITIKAHDGKPAGYDVWGDEVCRVHNPQKESFHAGRHVVEISARTWRGVQTERLLIVWPPPESGGRGKDVLIDGDEIVIKSL